MQVTWTPAAIGHLTGIYQFIASNSPRYAETMVDRITARSHQLSSFPLSGGVVSEFDDPQVREVIEGAYRVIYRVLENRVEVLAVIHGARMLPPLP